MKIKKLSLLIVLFFSCVIIFEIKNVQCENPPLPPCKITGYVYWNNSLITKTHGTTLVAKYGEHESNVYIDSSGKYSMVIAKPELTGFEVEFRLKQNEKMLSKPILSIVPEPGELKVIYLKFW